MTRIDKNSAAPQVPATDRAVQPSATSPQSPDGIPIRPRDASPASETQPVRLAFLDVSRSGSPAHASRPGESVLGPLVRASVIDRLLLNSPNPADGEDVRRFADAIAAAGHCVVLRHHPKTYGQIGHISAMVVKQHPEGRHSIGVGHHENVNLLPDALVHDGAMPSAAGIRWDTYDTRSVFKSLLGDDLPLEKLPASRSALASGFPASTIIPCSDPDSALAHIERETLRSRRMLQSRESIRSGTPAAEHQPLDGVPPYAFSIATEGPSDQAFYTPARPGAAPAERAAAMRNASARQVNNCFEYTAGILMSANASGAGSMRLGMSAADMGTRHLPGLVGGLPATEILRARMEQEGIRDINSFAAFRWLGKRWGQMQPSVRQWDVVSTRTHAAM